MVDPLYLDDARLDGSPGRPFTSGSSITPPTHALHLVPQEMHPTAEIAGGVFLLDSHSSTYGLGSLTTQSIPHPTYQTSKRILDLVVAIIALCLVSPLCLLVIVAIAMTSPGAIFFHQDRCGRGGRTFRLWKFRTMVANAEDVKAELRYLNEVSGPMFKVRRDPRITPVGRWLRKFSIDEVPQLLNVIRGEMTLVGPRPSLPSEVSNFTDFQRRRLEVKPGLTCLWQVSGRSDLQFDEWVELDVEYIRTRSLWLDLKIMVRTIPAVLTGRGAY